MTRAARPKVVIIGGGFGGLYAARALKRALVDVTLVDRTNHHLFQPLLYQVATATLAPTDITAPIRWLLRKQRNASVLLAEVTDIDVGSRTVRLEQRATLPYDYLIVATGSRHSYFGHAEWEKIAPGLKSIDDAIVIRQRFLLAFERAERAAGESERKKLLTFVVVGGGPTGVELAGMLPLIARRTLPAEFRNIDSAQSRVILLEGGPRVLPTFSENLSGHARRELEELGVEVRTGTRVTGVERGAVLIGDERIETETIFWAAGNETSAARPVPRRAAGPRRPREGGAGPVRARPSRSVRRRRPGADEHGRETSPRRRAGGDAERHARSAQHHPPRRATADGAVPLSEQGRSRDHRPPSRRRAASVARDVGQARVVVLAVPPHHVPRGLPQSSQCADRVGVFLLHLSAGGASDYRPPGTVRRMHLAPD